MPTIIEANVITGEQVEREMTVDEIAAIPPPPSPVPPDPKKETADVSQKMIDSGIFKPLLVMLTDYYLTKIKARPEADGLSDEQIIDALSTPSSPYYEPDFVKVQNYTVTLMSI